MGDDVTIVGGLGLGTSATTTNGQFELSGDIQVGDDISVTDDVTILGGLGIGIGTTTNGFLELTGSIYGAGDLSVTDAVTVLGNVALGDNSADTLTVTATTTFAGGGVTVSAGGLSVTGTGVLSVTGTATSTFTGGITAGGFDSSEGLNITGSSIRLTSGATSTFDNGLNLSAGCFAVNGNCAVTGSGGGTFNTGTANRLTYYSSTNALDSANFLTAQTGGNFFGISSSSPSQALSLGGNAWLDSNYIYIGSSSQSVASTTIVYFKSATTTIQQNVNAFSISTTTSTSTPSNNLFPIFSVDGLNGRIGIGTATPYASLSINQNLSVPAFSVGSTTGTSFVVASDGKVGVGTTTPARNLSVSGELLVRNGFFQDSFGPTNCTGDEGETVLYNATTGQFSCGTDGGGGAVTVNTGTASRLAYYSATDAINSIGFLAINTAGNLFGVASTSPSQHLSVGGNLYLDSNLITIGSSTARAASTTIRYLSLSTSTIPAAVNAWSIALSSDSATAPTPIFSVNGASSLVGIGTSSPWGTFSVERGSSNPVLVVSDQGTLEPYLSVANTGYTGIGSSSAAQRLGVSGNVWLDSNMIYIGSTTAVTGSTTIQYFSRATSTVANSIAYAWTIATSSNYRVGFSTGTPIFAISTNGRTASTTASGDFSIDGGAFVYDSLSGTTSADIFQIGPMTFDQDAGIVSWIDMAIATTATNIIMSYTAQLDSEPGITVFATTSGSGFQKGRDVRIGLATSTSWNGVNVTASGTVAVQLDFGANSVNAVCHSGTDIDSTAPSPTYDDVRELVPCNPGTLTDYAEYYPTEDDVGFGDIVAVGETSVEVNAGDGLGNIDESANFKISKLVKASNRQTIIGIISKNFGDFTALGEGMISPADRPLPVALNGRVPVKVSNENGEIKAGDRIALSSLAGIGAKATTSGISVGIALGSFDGSNSTTSVLMSDGKSIKTGEVMVFVNLGYSRLDSLASLAAATTTEALATNAWFVDQQSGKVNIGFLGNVNLNGNDIINVGKILSAGGKWSIDEDGTLIATRVITEEVIAQKLSVRDSLKIGTPEKPIGITIFDEATGEPYCIKVKEGAMVSAAGECGVANQSESQVNTSESMNNLPVEEPSPAEEPFPQEETPPAEEPLTSDTGSTAALVN